MTLRMNPRSGDCDMCVHACTQVVVSLDVRFVEDGTSESWKAPILAYVLW